jgi:hypothetical protein
VDDNSSTLSIDDGGGAITVDGTVTANLSATDNGVLDDIASATSDVGNCTAIAGADQMRVDVIAALPAGSNAIGKLAANTGVDIGDVDVTSVVPGTAASNLGKAEDAAHSSGDVGVMALAVRQDTPSALGADNDYTPLKTTELGSVWTAEQGGVPYKNIDCDQTEDAVSANPCRLMGFTAYNLHASDKRYLKLYNATTGTVVVGTTAPTMTFPLDAGQGMTWSTPLLFSTALTVAATTGVADNDSGAPGANEVVFNCGYVDL